MVKERYKGKSLLKCISDYTVIDLETTGRSIYDCEIIEMSAVRVRNNEIVAEYSELVCPKNSIPLNIKLLTGISNEMVADKPTIEEALQGYIDFLGNDILLGHNITSFDINILYDTYENLFRRRLSNDYIDTLRFVRHCDIDTNNKKLSTLAEYFNIVNENVHRSLYDCRTNHLVYQRLKECFDEYYSSSTSKSNRGYVNRNFSDETRAINELQDILKCIINQDLFDIETAYEIKEWLEENHQYINKYPFNKLNETISDVIYDGIVDEAEKEVLYALFNEVLNPVKFTLNFERSIDIKNLKLCLTGDFISGSRNDVQEKLKSMGAVIQKAVSSKTDYLIVGNLGSNNWSCGNYGSKIKKALELQDSGKNVQIINETDFWGMIDE